MAGETTSHLVGVLSPSQLAGLGGAGVELTHDQELAVQKAYADAFRTGMVVAAGVSAAALIAAAVGWQPERLKITQMRDRLDEQENERREKQVASARVSDTAT